jgi:hypothetical protein
MLLLSVGSISQHLNLILLWVVFKIYSSNRYHFNASHNLHSSQDCLIPVLITVLITAVCHISTHNMYAYSCLYACTVQLWPWTEYPLQGMLAVDTLPLLNVCTHLVPVEYGMAWWLSASCSSSWHSHGFMPWRIDILMYRCFCFMDLHVWMKQPILWYLCLKYMCTSAHVPLYWLECCKYMVHAFTVIYSISCLTTLLAKN